MRLRQVFKRIDRTNDEVGAATVEYALALPVCLMLLFFAIAIGWYWWTQNITAVAIHEGANLDAIHGGGVGGLPLNGAQRFKNIVSAGLGSDSRDFRSHFRLYDVPDERSVEGQVTLQDGWYLPFAGLFRFVVRAQSFQRSWQFYGGPSIRGSQGPWE